jgi:hypothetical protein
MIAGHQISKELCDALGLPRQTRGFTLRCYVGELVTVECEYCPDGDFQTTLAQYHLVPRAGKCQAPAPFNYEAWHRQRIERAHSEFMERTAALPRCDGRVSLAEKLARYFGDRRY